jgi:hypothetical protein
VVNPGDPNDLFAALQGSPHGTPLQQAIYRSTSGGSSWNILPVQPTSGPVWALAFTPVSPYRLYAGTMEDGLQASQDLGQSWYREGGLPGKADVRSLAIAFDGSRLVSYVGTTGGELATVGQQLASLSSSLVSGGVYRKVVAVIKTYLPLLSNFSH